MNRPIVVSLGQFTVSETGIVSFQGQAGSIEYLAEDSPQLTLDVPSLQLSPDANALFQPARIVFVPKQ
ncbi:MAG: hypothetical protein Q7R47_04695 [Candidatus Diapherotrites archaeon]|nr:hypothetical protein [Candidatus Diapherotrites archaeon]